MQDVRAGRAHLRAAETSFDPARPASFNRANLERAKGELFLAERSMRAASNRTAWLAGLPIGGLWPQAPAAAKLLGATADFSLGAEYATDGLAPLVDALAEPASGGSTGERVTAALQAGQPALQKALALIRPAEAQLDGLPPDALSGLGSQAASAPDQLRALASGLEVLASLPEVLGANGQRRYLIASENPADLRATGGYLGSWGVATLQGGRLSSLDYHGFTAWPGSSTGELDQGYDSHNFRPPPGWDVFEQAPGQLVERDGWWSEDANWYPDFPTTARVMEAFWQLGEQPVDGVIVLDTYAMQDLLRALGPLVVPGYGETITADNLIERAEFYEGRGPDLTRPLSEREDKTFLATLAATLLGRLKDANRDELVRVAGALQQAIVERHLLISLHDPTAARVLQDQGWDGSLYDGPGDYLMLVDQNTTYTKIASHVDRKLAYSVQVQPDLSATAELSVTYTNQQQTIDQRIGFTSDFRDFARLYVPSGSTLLSSDGFDGIPRTYDEAGHTVFGGFVYVPMAQSRTITLRYRLPSSIFAGNLGSMYRLYVQKQAGLAELPFQARISFPGGTSLTSLGRVPASISGQTATFGGSFRRDQDLRVRFSGGLPAPAGNLPLTPVFSGDRADLVRQIPEVAAILALDGSGARSS